MNQLELKSLLSYDAFAGLFTWRVDRGKIKAGTVAGTLDPNGYIIIYVNGKNYRAHRLAWLYLHGNEPKQFIDHINGIKSDNRICNLREATKSQNGMNTGPKKNNTSGFKGVSLCKQTGKWQSIITLDGKATRLGRFSKKEDAVKAYNTYAKQIHGEFYREACH